MFKIDQTPSLERLSTSQARERLSRIIHFVQDPRNASVITRHGQPVAAIVSMEEWKRIWMLDDFERMEKKGWKPLNFRTGYSGFMATEQEAAEHIHRLQLDRKMEREVLKNRGMLPVKGGELEEVVEVLREPEGGKGRKKRWWWFW